MLALLPAFAVMIPRSLYIHVPFCVRRCSYCDFAVDAVRDPPVDAWLEAVTRELELTAADQRWFEPLSLDTLYIGGGTPSLLGEGVMGRLRDRIERSAVLNPEIEWTCEANPESFTQALAEDWRAAGVNRISLGAQTFDSEALKWMARLHGPDGPERAVHAARGAGIENISVDLIFGLPARLGRNWSRDLERVIGMEPEHVSLYGLTAEAGAPLGRWVSEGREVLATEDQYAEEYLVAHRMLTSAGFEHYEVSNFARPGRRSRHNVAYWTGAPYAALGPGSHSFLPPVRRWNLRSWSAYRESVEAGRLPVEGEEEITADLGRLERNWLGLRTDGGLRLAELTDQQDRTVMEWVAGGLATIVTGSVRLTPTGWLLLDELAVALEAPEARAGAARQQSGFDDLPALVHIGANSNHSEQ